MPDTDNGRVTLAVINSQLEHLTQLLEKHIEDDAKCRDDHETRIRSLEKRTTQIEGKQTAIAAGQSVFTAVAALLAGWFGSRQ
jgi:hypothetical protein